MEDISAALKANLWQKGRLRLDLFIAALNVLLSLSAQLVISIFIEKHWREKCQNLSKSCDK